MLGEWGKKFRWSSIHSDALIAIGVVGLVLLLVIPLPLIFLDTFLCMSIVLSVMVLLLTLYVEKALDFSAFPSVLLFLTLFRLGLNIASTRLILTRAEAGDVIRTFGEFVTQGSLIVGFILFGLLTIINFLVVTKGAGRIAEVTARFTLEALPGKQMAIDSELSSGLITQEQAQAERKKLSIETDFYGAMDGASKFVKGDAIAGLIITCVNLVGGFLIGLVIKGMDLDECCLTITSLTIGDGLVSQIPALLVSVGAAMMVTRVSSVSIGKVVTKQLFHQPKILFIAGGVLVLLSCMPGMPRLVMLPLSCLLFYVGYLQKSKKKEPSEIKTEIVHTPSLLVPPLEIRLGYQVVILAEPIKERVNEIRQKVAAHLGVCMPSVAISDQVSLSPTAWAILVRGVRVAHGRDPDLPVLTKELEHVIEEHAHELLTRQTVAVMLQEVKSVDSAVVDELLGKKMSVGQILRVLQNLLKEGVPIRDFVTILEILADHAHGENSDLDVLTEEVRRGLSGGISEEFFGKTHSAHVITLDPQVEQMIVASKTGLRSKTIDQLARRVIHLHEAATSKGIYPVVVTAPSSRLPLKKILDRHLPKLPVLSYAELTTDIELHHLGVVSNEILI